LISPLSFPPLSLSLPHFPLSPSLIITPMIITPMIITPMI
ncbi:PREDICTED: uncharacterized protein LOC106820629, partial [Priapulus caudatus]|uniref:Uncharacterized protein LOC106820629 n=1 Tax=Priapulus caudatus TaxID=37621 RepID=A0ABM1F849_PRICU